MKLTRNTALAAVALLMALGCTDDPLAEAEVVVTPDINVAPYYFSFAAGNAVSNLPDITLLLDTTKTPSLYSVSLNSSAGVGAVAAGGSDFASGVIDPFDDVVYDGASMVIGASWSDFDVASYDPTDNHSFTSNGSFFYLRLASYDVVKFQVTKASQVAFDIDYAIQANDSTAGSMVSKVVSYTIDSPAEFDFTTGASLASVDWNIGLIMQPVLEPNSGQIFPTPAVIVNYGGGTRVALLTRQDFDDLTSVPSGAAWLDETGSSRPFGYGGTFETLVYQGPPTHKVLVQNPDYVYIVDDGAGNFYKLRFIDYTSGIVGFEYLAL